MKILLQTEREGKRGRGVGFTRPPLPFPSLSPLFPFPFSSRSFEVIPEKKFVQERK